MGPIALARIMTRLLLLGGLAQPVLACLVAAPAFAQATRPSGPLAAISDYLQGPCAVIVGGDDTSGVGAKDADAFNNALLNYVEWLDPAKPGVRVHRPRSVVVIAGGATHNSIHSAIQSMEPPNFECTLLVFFYSGHGERHGSPSATYASFVLRMPPSGGSANPADRVDRGELGSWLAEFQKKNPLSRSTGGPQSAFEPAPVLVILQACHAGAWIGGAGGLDQQIINANGGEVLMSSKAGECSYGSTRAGGNSFFVGNLLTGMGAGGPVSGFSIFEAADKTTTDEARRMCRGCSQHPEEWSNPPMTTVYLHQ